MPEDMSLTRINYTSKHSIGGLLKASKTIEVEDSFFDFVPNGISVAQQAFGVTDWASGSGYVTPYCTAVSPKWRWEQHQCLMGGKTGDLPFGRVGLYYCGLCFSLDDGILSIVVDATDDVVRWSSFGWQDDPGKSFDPLDGYSYMTFKKADYLKKFGTVLYDLETEGLRRVLNKIDFIGVEPGTGPEDEYDCMISDILAILHGGGGHKELQSYLRSEISGHFGLGSGLVKRFRIADKIHDWWEKWPQAGQTS